MKCTDCASTDLVASTTERMDKKGHIFHVPCWFCEDCYHEEFISSDEAVMWLDRFYDKLPIDIRPKPKPKSKRSPAHRATAGLGAFDE